MMSADERSVATPNDWLFTFSFETYADAVYRGMMRPPDRILGTLFEHPAVRRLLVANPMRWLPRVLAAPVLDGYAKFPESERNHLVKPFRLRKRDPLAIAEVEREFANYDRALARAARRHGMRTPTVLTAHPLIAGFCGFEWAGGVTYFGRDDWLSTPSLEPLWPALSEAYRRLAASGRGVVAVSQQIIDRIDPRGPSLVLPNGVEPGEWEGPLPQDPDWLADVPHPRAIYVGTLDDRLDIEGIASLANAHPELHIVLLGPAPSGDHVAPIAHLPNVHTHPHVGRAELVAALRNADLCLLAHRRTPLTEAMSPLKVYEYLAAGSPVLATDLPPVRGISDRVLLSEQVADFADLVPAALALGPWSEAERSEFISQNAWSQRHEQLLSLAASVTPA